MTFTLVVTPSLLYNYVRDTSSRSFSWPLSPHNNTVLWFSEMGVYLELSNLFNILDYSLNVAILSIGDCKILEADNMHSGSAVYIVCICFLLPL